MKHIWIFIILLSLSAEGNSQNLRNVSWGMSPDDVQKIEPLKLFKKLQANPNNIALVYKDFVFGDSIYVWYQFLYNSLSSISYQVYLSSTMEQPYQELIKYVDLLKKKYTEPLEVKWDCSDSNSKSYIENASNKDDEMNYLFYDGDIKEILYRWATGTTLIHFSIKGNTVKVNGREVKYPGFSIIYQSYDFDNLFEKAKKEQIENKL